MIIDRTGISPTDVAGYKAELEGYFRDAWGQNLILDSETPQGQIIGVLSLALAEIDEVAVAVANGLSLYQAIGLQIDSLGSLMNLPRIAGERSTVTVTITGTANTIIPAGSLARTAAGDQFSLDDQVTIPTSGSVSAGMRSIDLGSIPAAAGALSEIVTVVSGWTGITNPAAATPGRRVETDGEYLRRYLMELARNSRDGLESIQSRVLAVEGVQRALVVENSTGSPVTEKGTTIPARSIVVVAEGGTDAAVAAAIFAAKPAGVATSGTTTVSVSHASGRSTDVNFIRAAGEPLAIAVTIVLSAVFPSNGLRLIQERCVAWVNGSFEALPGQFDRGGLGIGDNLDINRMYTPIQSVPGHTVTNLAVTLRGGNALPTDLALNKRYTLAESDVTITVTT